MPSPYLCALVSKLTYETTDTAVRQHLASLSKDPNWSLLKSSSLHHSYYGIAIYNRTTKEVIIGHRGTDFAIFDNIQADLHIFKHLCPEESRLAKEFSASVRQYFNSKYTFTETGHSLGGAYAELNAQYFDNFRAVTFDSPGTGEILRKVIPDCESLNITSYLTAPNPINTCNTHFGTIIRLYIHHINRTGISSSSTSQQGLLFITSLAKYLLGLESMSQLISSNLWQFFQRSSNDLYAYYKRQHSIDLITDVFDPDLGVPYLQRRMQSWPSQVNFKNWLFKTSDKSFQQWLALAKNLSSPDALAYNIETESLIRELSGYKPLEFLLLAKNNGCPKIVWNNYCSRVLERFDEYYLNNNYRLNIIQRLDNKSCYINFQKEKRIMPNQMQKKYETSRKNKEAKIIEVSSGIGTVGGAVSLGSTTVISSVSSALSTVGVSGAALTVGTIATPVVVGLAVGYGTGKAIVGISNYMNKDTLEYNKYLKEEKEKQEEQHKQERIETEKKFEAMQQTIAQMQEMMKQMQQNFNRNPGVQQTQQPTPSLPPAPPLPSVNPTRSTANHELDALKSQLTIMENRLEDLQRLRQSRPLTELETRDLAGLPNRIQAIKEQINNINPRVPSTRQQTSHSPHLSEGFTFFSELREKINARRVFIADEQEQNTHRPAFN